MNKRGLILVLLAGWGISRLMGPNGASTREKIRGKAEQFRGRIEQALGSATGSTDTSVRGEFTQAKGMGREKVADVEAAIDELAGY